MEDISCGTMRMEPSVSIRCPYRSPSFLRFSLLGIRVRNVGTDWNRMLVIIFRFSDSLDSRFKRSGFACFRTVRDIQER